MGQSLFYLCFCYNPAMKILRVFILAFLFSPAVFLNAETFQQAHTEIELVSDSASVRPGQSFNAAVRFKMEPGWHIYWINPGDSGLPPKIQWQLPEGWSAGSVQWPHPEKITQGPLASYGYEGEVFLISQVQVPASQSPGEVTLKAKVDWLACEVDCIPGKGEVSLILKTGEAQPDARWTQAFSETSKKWPIVMPDKKITASISEVKILIHLPENTTGGTYFFPESAALIHHAGPQIVKDRELKVPLAANPEKIGRLRGVLMLNNAPMLLDVPLTSVPVEIPAAGMTFLTAIIFAFLGGLILNLMPCVLPVLSLKILNFIKEAAENPRDLFKHGLVFTAGVLVSFWFLAGALLILKAAGKAVGWGFQLQSPVFLIILTIIFFVFALNLLGVFEIGVSLTRVNAGNKKGFAGSFLSGVFATVVATPCTAPFMGAALGFSLAQPAWISFSVFTALALGMAAPYLLLCAQPAFLKFVPKPGIWMVRLKQFLSLPLFATCAWLIWVLSLQWGGTPQGKVSADKIAWEVYSENRLGQLLDEEKAVFIDFTAAWCLTCKVNERVTLDSPKVVDAFRSAGIAALKADWTSQDPAIEQALAKYGRNSIPLYVFYPAGSRKAILLPEILTPSKVLEYLKRPPELA